MPRIKSDKSAITIHLQPDLLERADRVLEDDRQGFRATHKKSEKGVPNRSVWIEAIVRAEVERREAQRAELVSQYLACVPGGDVSQPSVLLQREIEEAESIADTDNAPAPVEPLPPEDLPAAPPDAVAEVAASIGRLFQRRA